MRAVFEGERSTDESQRKSQAVRAGLGRRKDSGAPVGAMPWGYAVEPTGEIDRTGKAVMRRIPDEATLTTAEQIAERIASGSTPGAVARWLNAERVRTRRGGTWSTRSVRDWIRLAALIGEDGYPALLDRELWLAANAQLKRLDPVAVAGRSGGRPPADDSFILRQVARCARCGRPLWTRSYESGRRAYVCSAVREARGTCDAERIPAPEVERVVIEHLNQFVGSLESWLADVASASDDEQRRREAQIAREQATLTDLRASRDRHLASYSRLIEAGDALASVALEPIRALDERIAASERTIAETGALVAEWEGPPDLAAAAAVYAELQQLAAGRVAQARGAQAVNDALRDVLSGMWLEWEPHTGRVLGQFKLRPPDGTRSNVPRLCHGPLRPFADEIVRSGHTSQSTLV